MDKKTEGAESMDTIEVQDLLERATYRRMDEGEGFFSAVETAEAEDGNFTALVITDDTALVEVEGQRYELSREWILHRRYPR